MAQPSRTMQLLAAVLLLVHQTTAQYPGAGSSSGGYGGGSSSGSGGSSSDGSSGGASGGADSYSSFASINKIALAHGVLGALAWVILFPLGSILLRTVSGSSAWKVHGLIQVLAFIVFAVAIGLGIWLARRFGAFMPIWSNYHVVLGLVIFAFAAIMPFLGLIHHSIFVGRRDGKRTGIGRIHLWLGRILIILGIVNGGLGLKLASQAPLQSPSTTKKAEIGYAVAAAVMFALYAFVALWSEIKRRRAPPPPRRRSRHNASRRTSRQGHHGRRRSSGGARSSREKRSPSSSLNSSNPFVEQGWRVHRTNDGPMVRRDRW